MRTLAAATLALLACAACERPAAEAPPSSPPPPVRVPAPQAAWTLDAATLVHRDAAGAEVLRLTCGPRPAELQAALPAFTRIASEDRLTVGFGDELATLVVSMDGADQGLIAAGEPQPAILGPLAAGASVGVSYGARQLTLPGPPPALAASFAAVCAG